jgi:2-iminobutanoate/2-iminopropanoate deaminase
MFTVIRGQGVPESHLPFSPAVKAGNLVFVSGQASVDEQGAIVHDTFAGEVRRSFENVEKVLAGAGLSLKHVVRVTSYVGRQQDLAEYNELYRTIFAKPFPARTTLIGCLGDVVKFEVDVIAVAPEAEL